MPSSTLPPDRVPLRAVPALPWSARSRWRARPATLLVLLAGLWVFGTGEALLVASRLGNTPWTTLAQGVSRHTPLSIGAATLVISAVVLVGWVPLRERPGLGTLANAVLIAVALQTMLHVLPRPDALVGRSGEVLAGIVAIGVGSALYLSTWLGPGPRDGWMTGIARRLDQPLSTVRLSIEVSVLLAGWLLGGRVGIGTVLFAATIGRVVAAALAAVSRLATRPRRGQVISSSFSRTA